MKISENEILVDQVVNGDNNKRTEVEVELNVSLSLIISEDNVVQEIKENVAVEEFNSKSLMEITKMPNSSTSAIDDNPKIGHPIRKCPRENFGGLEIRRYPATRWTPTPETRPTAIPTPNATSLSPPFLDHFFLKSFPFCDPIKSCRDRGHRSAGAFETLATISLGAVMKKRMMAVIEVKD
ncbi:uncharacterized protein A4U43_C10F8220 [Asparagus officinalis]|uniref:Uncharacterized protein n=1 Tax=Asparagus officinalis TaxID=4686 RepID=A0A5P1E4K6_ASPOF|nr:uncharacterized protein A4U43_C10F8220 [Asparagus officinalis]